MLFQTPAAESPVAVHSVGGVDGSRCTLGSITAVHNLPLSRDDPLVPVLIFAQVCPKSVDFHTPWKHVNAYRSLGRAGSTITSCTPKLSLLKADGSSVIAAGVTSVHVFSAAACIVA